MTVGVYIPSCGAIYLTSINLLSKETDEGNFKREGGSERDAATCQASYSKAAVAYGDCSGPSGREMCN